MIALFSNEVFILIIVPILIFLARLIDVSLGTLRIILSSKGIKGLAAIIGFVEVLIWILALTSILENLGNVFTYLAYALGFSTGTYVGVILEEKISVGKVVVRIMTKKDLVEVIDNLTPTKYVYLSEDVDSSDGKIRIINALIERKHLASLIASIKRKDPSAFYTVEDIRVVKEDAKLKKHFLTLRKGK